MNSAMIETLSSNALNWLLTKLILREKEKGGEYFKQWYRDAVDNGEQFEPYCNDWQWCGELIEGYCISLESIGDVWKGSCGAFDCYDCNPMVAAVKALAMMLYDDNEEITIPPNIA